MIPIGTVFGSALSTNTGVFSDLTQAHILGLAAVAAGAIVLASFITTRIIVLFIQRKHD